MEHGDFLVMLLEMTGKSNKKTGIIISGLYKQIIKHFIKIVRYNDPDYNNKHIVDIEQWYLDIQLLLDTAPSLKSRLKDILCKHTCSLNKFKTLVAQVDRDYSIPIVVNNINYIHRLSLEFTNTVIDRLNNDLELNMKEIATKLNIKGI